MIARVFVLAALLATGACSTMSRETVFDGAEPGVGLAVIVADGMPTGLTTSDSYIFIFRRVDLTTSTFQPETIFMSFEPYAAIASRELRKPPELQTSVRFGSARAAAGDYALVQRLDRRPVLGTDHCYTLGSRVFRVEPGKVSIVAVGSVNAPTRVYPEAVEKQVRAVLGGYSKITAPLAMAAEMGTLRFEQQAGAVRCVPEPQFSFAPDS